ncbi:MAG: ATP-binding cassette domain-containing protein [Peptococcaceae bacterium]|nr:ATP-binding cassette domain-containing protein [Peptococcaceae bacterium]MBP3626132.1 ATP-binding cassette domain-containing protein [Peptococcaceae bacterium]
MNIIETKELSHKQGSKYLLQDINWQVKEKEHWVVFGINGCGKTTLLSTICGYRSHNKGECFLFGEKLTKENAVALRRQVGFVSASYMDRCFQNESGLDIILSAKFGGFGRQYHVADADIRRARNLLKAFGIAAKGDYPYCMLSQGQKQRVLLARALMVPPKLLILDEPLNGLDVYARDFFLNTLQEIEATTDVTIIYVTHHAEEILPFFTKAMLLQNGKIFAQGDLNDVFSNESLSRYFGHPTNAEWQGNRFYIGIGAELRMQRAIWE